MVFSSLSFLILFLPPVLGLYYVLPNKWRNYELFIASIVFYAMGEPVYVFLFLAVILWNWIFGIVIEKTHQKKKKILLAICLIGDIGVLCLFKYGAWLAGKLPLQTGLAERLAGLGLPVGISFYCFQAVSYAVDTYRGEQAQKNPVFLGLYLAFFPQLIAGPIVRYSQFAPQITKRKTKPDKFCKGIIRFSAGLCKKVLLANTLGAMADHVFDSAEIGSMSSAMIWLGAFGYMLQIFFDFSGYSDMAIGLGAMFGFQLPENFDDPYTAGTATDFWRRWHMTLSGWFRDYVYIPLGGSRVCFPRECINLMIVWMLTGAWHGAGKTFLLWGILWGCLLILEKGWIKPETRSKLFRRLYRIAILFWTLLLWVIFRSLNMESAMQVLTGMFTFQKQTGRPLELWLWLHDMAPYLAVGIFLMLGGVSKVKKWVKRGASRPMQNVLYVLSLTGLFILTVLSLSVLVNGSYNPFLYFNF